MTESPTTQVFSSFEDDDYWEERIENSKVNFGDVVRLKFARTLEGSNNAETCERGNRYYQAALNAFVSKKGDETGGNVEAAVFDCGMGVYHETATGIVWYTIVERWIGFDWSAAHRLLNRVDSVYKLARDLWPVEPPERGNESTTSGPETKPGREERRELARRRRALVHRL